MADFTQTSFYTGGVASLRGPKGDTGATGAQGPAGPTGAPGLPGAKGEQGNTGPRGLKGDKGDTGAQGEQGPQGLQGATLFKLPMFATYAPTASETLALAIADRDITFPANFAGSQGYAEGFPSAPYVLSIRRTGVEVGTITFSTAGVATFASVGGLSVSVATGQVLAIVAPATADNFVSNLVVTLAGA